MCACSRGAGMWRLYKVVKGGNRWYDRCFVWTRALLFLQVVALSSRSRLGVRHRRRSSRPRRRPAPPAALARRGQFRADPATQPGEEAYICYAIDVDGISGVHVGRVTWHAPSGPVPSPRQPVRRRRPARRRRGPLRSDADPRRRAGRLHAGNRAGAISGWRRRRAPRRERGASWSSRTPSGSRPARRRRPKSISSSRPEPSSTA